MLEQILKEGEISDANIRLLVNQVVVNEQDGMIDISIRLNAKFTNHILTYDMNCISINESKIDLNLTKKDTFCNKLSVSFIYA